MIPQLVTVRVNRFRIWVPVLPVLLLLVPAVVVACLVYRISVWRALGAGWRILCALRGTLFDIADGETAVLVRFR